MDFSNSASKTAQIVRPADSTTKIHFRFVDALRGIAAFWVVLFHAQEGGHIPHLVEVLPSWLVTVVFKWGRLGVPIFFVLSGFVIAHSLRKGTIDLSFFSRFTLRRLCRLSPPYYASIAITVAISLLGAKIRGGSFSIPSGPAVVAHLLYLQDILGFDPINSIYWTLCLEIQFYLVFCALLVVVQKLDGNQPQPQRSKRFLVFGIAAAIAALYALGILPETFGKGWFLPLWHGFLLGVFAYWAWNKEWKASWFYGYAAIVLVGALGHLQSTLAAYQIAFVITATLLLEVGRANRMATLLDWRWLQFLGLVSYSLYLIHNPVSATSFFVTHKFLGSSALGEAIALMATIAVCVIAAYLLWRFCEKPSIKLSQQVKLNRGD